MAPRILDRLVGLVMPRVRPFTSAGVMGQAVYGGYPRTYEKSPDWIGRKKWTTASEIATNISIVASGIHYFLNLVAHPEWSVKPSDENNSEAVKLAEFTEEVLQDMKTPWSRVVRRAGMYRFHGFGIQEWIATKRDDGMVVFKDIEPRPQWTIEKWEVTDDGFVLGVWQRSPQTGHLYGLPRGKIIYLVDDTITDSPEGLGLLRHMAEPYTRLKRLQELEIMAYERDLRGTPIGRAPITALRNAVTAGEIKAEEATALIKSLESFVELESKQPSTGMVLDSQPYQSLTQSGIMVAGIPQWQIELMQGAGGGLAELDRAIIRIQTELARIMGIEHMMLGSSTGSANRALSQDKSQNLYLIANSVLQNIAFSMRNDLIKPLWVLNGFDEALMPHLATEDVAFKSVEEVTASLAQMAQAGAVLLPTDPVINDVRDILGVSRMPEPGPDQIGALSDVGGLQDDVDKPETPQQAQQQAAQMQQVRQASAGKPKGRPTASKRYQLGKGWRDVSKGLEDRLRASYGPYEMEAVDRALGELIKYDPSQARDELGRWTATGAAAEGLSAREAAQLGQALSARVHRVSTWLHSPQAKATMRDVLIAASVGLVWEIFSNYASDALLNLLHYNGEITGGAVQWAMGGLAKLIGMGVTKSVMVSTVGALIGLRHTQIGTKKVVDDVLAELMRIEAALQAFDPNKSYTLTDPQRTQLEHNQIIRKYSPDQPRDEHGRWTRGGGPGSVGIHHVVAGHVTRHVKERHQRFRDWIRSTPVQNHIVGVLGSAVYAATISAAIHMLTHMAAGESAAAGTLVHAVLHHYAHEAGLTTHNVVHMVERSVESLIEWHHRQIELGKAEDEIDTQLRQVLDLIRNYKASAYAKYSEDQPRDEHGRWTSEGGSASTPGTKAHWLKTFKTWLSSKLTIEAMAKAAKEAAVEVAIGTAVSAVTHWLIHLSGVHSVITGFIAAEGLENMAEQLDIPYDKAIEFANSAVTDLITQREEEVAQEAATKAEDAILSFLRATRAAIQEAAHAH